MLTEKFKDRIAKMFALAKESNFWGDVLPAEVAELAKECGDVTCHHRARALARAIKHFGYELDVQIGVFVRLARAADIDANALSIALKRQNQKAEDLFELYYLIENVACEIADLFDRENFGCASSVKAVSLFDELSTVNQRIGLLCADFELLEKEFMETRTKNAEFPNPVEVIAWDENEERVWFGQHETLASAYRFLLNRLPDDFKDVSFVGVYEGLYDWNLDGKCRTVHNFFPQVGNGGKVGWLESREDGESYQGVDMWKLATGG